MLMVRLERVGRFVHKSPSWDNYELELLIYHFGDYSIFEFLRVSSFFFRFLVKGSRFCMNRFASTFRRHLPFSKRQKIVNLALLVTYGCLLISKEI